MRLAEAPGTQTIFDYAPESNGAIDYGALAAEVVALPPPAPWIETAPAIVEEPKPEPVVIAAPDPEPVPEPEPIVIAVPEPEPAPEPVEVAFAEVAPREPEPIHIPMAVVTPAPVANAEPLTEPGSFAHKLAMAGLKPIVVRRPGMEKEEKRPGEGGLTQKILGKLFGKK